MAESECLLKLPDGKENRFNLESHLNSDPTKIFFLGLGV